MDRRSFVLATAGAAIATSARAQEARAASLAGRWTFRSFQNLTENDGDFAKLRLANGVLEIAPYQGNDFTGTLTTERWQLSVKGKIDGERFVMDATKGSDNTAGWHYSYNGLVVSRWKEAVEQVPTLVGSVLRVTDHDNLRGGWSKGGLTYSFIIVRQAA